VQLKGLECAGHLNKFHHTCRHPSTDRKPTIRNGQAWPIPCFLEFQEIIPTSYKIIPPSGVKSVELFSAKTRPDDAVACDGRTLVS